MRPILRMKHVLKKQLDMINAYAPQVGLEEHILKKI